MSTRTVQSREIKTATPPRVAVVVPIFRHSALLSEAIESVLAQQADFAIRLILVNDGCPHVETDAVCRDYAASYPDRIVYLRKPNGGLSDARNFGIRHVLAHEPSVEAVYLLDADNRIRPQSMARAFAALQADPALGWIYPNIDMFGLQSAHDYGGPYSRLLHSTMNTCEAGSLISRKVFEAGVLFDTNFKQGFEDWEFFLSAASAGFVGANLEEFGFQYRKRPESMLADSEREGAGIRAAMQQKHKTLFQPKTLIEFEQKETPRYAILLSDRNEIRLTTDPRGETEVLTQAEYERRLWLSQANPSRYGVAPWLIVTSSGFLAQLEAAGLTHFAFWRLEHVTDEAGIGVCALEVRDEDRIGVRVDKASGGNHLDASAIMIRPRLLSEVLRDSGSAWVDSLWTTMPMPDIRRLTLSVPADRILPDEHGARGAVLDFLSFIHRLRASRWRDGAMQAVEWRTGDLKIRAEPYRVIRQRLNGAVAYPRIRDGKPHVGLTIPIVEFGGVEKVALNVARVLKAQGFGVHLFVLLAEDAAISREWAAVIDSVNFLSGTGFAPWGGGEQAYFGTEIPRWAQHGNHAPALGALYWLDSVIDFHGGALVAVMGKLKRLGVRTVSSLHLSDMSPVQRPVGNTYLAMAHEHAFDVFAPCSLQLADWLHGMGVPQEKIVPLVNAPAFPISAADLEACLTARRARDDTAPLRVLFLGRLDPQKGLDRLTVVVAETETLNLTWRIVGKAVLADAKRPLSPVLQKRLEPALSTAEELVDAYAWADVVVLLSEFEGLPLTILEAMRQGVVVVATDVGAVSEAVRDNENGILLPLADANASCVRALRTLAADRATLRRLSEQAVADSALRDWEHSAEGLVSFLNAAHTSTGLVKG